MFSLFFRGLGVSLGLIVAIGAQNAFVLRQGLKREWVGTVVLISALGDILLTFIGVNGLGGVLARSPQLSRLAAWGGAAFLGAFAYRSFRSAWRPKTLAATAPSSMGGTRRAIALQAVLFSLLNPHAILDTVVILGSIGAQYELIPRQVFFSGAVVASIGWFSALGFGAAKLAPLFEKPQAWRILDLFIGVVMTAIAATLLIS